MTVFTTRAIPQAAITLVKEFEGFHATPYLCPGHILTIGYGHTRTVKPGMSLTPVQADALLRDDAARAARTVERLVKVPLNDNQFAALVSFTFNVGIGNFEGSTLLRLLNQGWYEQVPAQLTRWTRANGEVLGGLARRRAAEARLWGEQLQPASDDGE